MRVAIVGASGRMGRMLLAAVLDEPACRLVGALEREGSTTIGQDAGSLAGRSDVGIRVMDEPSRGLADAEVILDFTAPEATRVFASLAAERGLVHVVGTTGLSHDDFGALRAAAARARVVQSGNMSLGVNVLAALVRKAAQALGEDFDIEILEMHHRMKVDAPSGTALLLGEAAAAGREIALEERSVRTRDGHTGARVPGDIGFASLRGGSVVGEHDVLFAGPGEVLTLSHRASDRGLFARGAVRAALWARSQAPGYYSMVDVLGLAGV